ncbi:Sedlin, N-terminal conserved region-domain-containing protein [Yarrowia lipolytica]|nr:Sedlin, N-terminal conserved region-domain-containing protein [Yarrowia lipolytica]
MASGRFTQILRYRMDPEVGGVHIDHILFIKKPVVIPKEAQKKFFYFTRVLIIHFRFSFTQAQPAYTYSTHIVDSTTPKDSTRYNGSGETGVDNQQGECSERETTEQPTTATQYEMIHGCYTPYREFGLAVTHPRVNSGETAWFVYQASCYLIQRLSLKEHCLTSKRQGVQVMFGDGLSRCCRTSSFLLLTQNTPLFIGIYPGEGETTTQLEYDYSSLAYMALDYLGQQQNENAGTVSLLYVHKLAVYGMLTNTANKIVIGCEAQEGSESIEQFAKQVLKVLVAYKSNPFYDETETSIDSQGFRKEMAKVVDKWNKGEA